MYEDKLPSPVKHNGPKTPSRSKKPTTSGWAEETPKQTLEKKLSKIRLQDSEEDTTAAPKAVTANHIDSTKNSENVDRAAAFKELNADSISKLCLEGVNLRILLKNLVPESQLQEPDVPWNWDVLFAEIVSDITVGLQKEKSLN